MIKEVVANVIYFSVLLMIKNTSGFEAAVLFAMAIITKELIDIKWRIPNDRN
ncbi:hypothetical protein [Lactococcus lactis]|uniref:Uncharacterized protein n=1 Tax=Lactococcus lactis TaxID=1358 RepID=A0AAW5TQU7_9LACT|nr:hypothetical protein [Lactococcus lactis]MCW2279888.1 hypothetical protein [Lactococcus lactis]